MSRTNAVLTGKRSLCRSCGEYFSTTANFDRHRRGEHGKDRACQNPESVGLVLKQRGPSTFWSMPGEVEPVQV